MHKLHLSNYRSEFETRAVVFCINDIVVESLEIPGYQCLKLYCIDSPLYRAAL